MTHKRARESRGMFFTWGVLVGLIFLFTPKSLTGRLQLLYAQVFRWPLEAGRGLTLAARTTIPETAKAGHSSYEQLLAEKRRLEIDRANLQAKLREACQKIDDLAQLRNRPGWENMGLLSANVIFPAGPTQDQLIINQGRKNGVAAGQFVAGLDGGIIGTVAAVSPEVAKVRLITDPASKIPVYIGDPNVRGIMEGRGNGLARIPPTANTHKARVNDRVYVEKKPGVLDVPIVAAEVVECKPDPEHPVVSDVTVRPVSDVANLSEVVVLVPIARPQ
jgi:cell shape-determining protein MreC